MNRWRTLAYIDVVLAAIPGVMCLVAPSAFTGQFLRAQIPVEGLEFVRWLGGVYAFYAYLMWRGLRYGDQNFWRVWAPTALFGDALAIAGLVHTATLDSFVWGPPTWFTCAFYVVYLPFRVAIVLDPSRLDRSASKQQAPL